MRCEWMRAALALACAGCLVAPVRGADEGAPGLHFGDVGVYGADFPFCTFTCYKMMPSEDGYASMARLLADAHAAGKYNLLSLYCFDRVSHARPIEEYERTATEMLAGIDLTTVDAICLSEENVTWNNGLEVLNRLYDHVKALYPGPVYQWLTFPDAPHPKLKADGFIYDAYGLGYLDFRRYALRYLVTGKPLVLCINASPEVNDLAVTTEQALVCRELDIPIMYFAVDWDVGSPYHWLTLDKPELVPWRDRVWSLVRLARATDEATLPVGSAGYSPGGGIEVSGDAEGLIRLKEVYVDTGFIDRADVWGFHSLVWDGEEEALGLRRGGEATLTYHVHSWLPMEAPKSEALFDAGPGEEVRLELSADGLAFGAPADLAGFAGRELWLRATLSSEQESPGLRLRGLEFTARAVVPEERAIRLVPGGRVDQLQRRWVRYADEFNAQRYRLLGEVDNEAHLLTPAGEVQTHGVAGAANTVVLRQRFVCDQPLAAIRVRAEGWALERDFAAHNELSLSLDGADVLLRDTSAGRADANGRFDGWLEVDAGGDARLAGATSFWVHLTLVNVCGVATNATNGFRRLELLAEVATAP